MAFVELLILIYTLLVARDAESISIYKLIDEEEVYANYMQTIQY